MPPSNNRDKAGAAWRGVLWAVLFFAGTVGWIFYSLGPESGRAWRAFLINFIYFTPLSAGMVVWSAVVVISHGRWMGRAERIAATGASFALPSIAALAILWAGSANWAPWALRRFPQGAWLYPNFVLGRDMGALVVFWALCVWYLIRRSRGTGAVPGGLLVLFYGLAFSLLGFDMVMSLDPKWYSTLFGGYFFISGMYMAVTMWALIAALHPQDYTGKFHDLGNLIVAFSILTGYMMYPQLLVIWYEALPAEVRYLVPRMNFPPWNSVSGILLLAYYLGPLILLLTVWAKKTPWFLGLVSAFLLVVMWVERWWLVTPTLIRGMRFGLVEVAITAAFTGAFGFGIDLFYRRLPPVIPGEAGEP